MDVVAVGVTFLSLTVLFVFLRISTRLFFIRSLGWDDFFLVLSMLTNTVFFALTIIQVQNGLGKHQNTLSPQTVRNQLKALWITIPMYNLTMNFTKISMAILYLRAFKTKTYQRVLIVHMVYIIITGLWMLLGTIFFCTPIRGFWDKSIHSYCMPQIVVWCLNAALQITTDILTVILPMPALAKLHLARRQRVALMVVFSGGFFIVAVSGFRLSQLVEYIRGTDTTKLSNSATGWSFIETSVAIICASLPPLRPLIARLFPIRTSDQQEPDSTLRDTQNDTKPRKTPKRDSQQPLTFDPAYGFTNANTSYSASITGHCPENNLPNPNHRHKNSINTNNTSSTIATTATTVTANNSNNNNNINEKDPEDPTDRRSSSTRRRQPSAGGIHVEKRIFWDSDSAHSNDMVPPLEGGRQLQLEPYPGDSLPDPLPRSYQLPEIEP